MHFLIRSVNLTIVTKIYQLQWTCESTVFLSRTIPVNLRNAGWRCSTSLVQQAEYELKAGKEFKGGRMSKREFYEARTEELLKPIVESAGVEIYDVEYVKEGSDFYLRCYIDRDGGVNIQDCEMVSRALSDQLDAEDYIEDAYILEVSSPGLGRTLKKEKHLSKSIGMEVELKTFKPVNGSKDFEGVLKAFDNDTLTLTVEDDQDLVFQRKDIAVIKLALDF